MTLPDVGAPENIMQMLDILKINTKGQKWVSVPKRFTCPVPGSHMYFDAAINSVDLPRHWRCKIEWHMGLEVDHENWRVQFRTDHELALFCPATYDGTVLVHVWCCPPGTNASTCPMPS